MEDLIKLSSSEEFSKLTEIDKILLFLITKLDTTPYTKEDQGYIQGAIDLGKVRFVTSDQLANSSPQVLFQVGYGQKVVMEHNGIMISVVKKNTGDPQVQQNMITNNAHNNINNNNFVKLMQYKIDNYENPNTSISPSLSPYKVKNLLNEKIQGTTLTDETKSYIDAKNPNERQNQITYNNELTVKDIKNNSKKIQLFSNTEERQQIRKKQIDDKIVYYGSVDDKVNPHGVGLLEFDGFLYQIYSVNGYVTDVKEIPNTPYISSASFDCSNENSDYLCENGNILVFVEESRRLVDDVKGKITNEDVKDTNEIYGKKSTTVKEAIDDLNNNLMQSTKDQAAEFAANVLAVGAAAALLGGILYMSYTGTPILWVTSEISIGSTKVLGWGQTLLKRHGAWNLIQVTHYKIANILGGLSLGFGSGFTGMYATYESSRFKEFLKQYYEFYESDQENKCDVGGVNILCDNQPLLFFKENLMKIELFLQELTIEVANQINKQVYITKLNKEKIQTANTLLLLETYCTSDCDILKNKFSKLFSHNTKTQSLNETFETFYRYNDVNWTKGVYDFGFLLYNLITIVESESIIYYDNNISNFSKDHYKNIFSYGNYLKFENKEPKTNTQLSITKTAFKNSLEKYLQVRITTDNNKLDTIKLIIDNNTYVPYKDIEKFFKDLLVLNNFIYTDEKTKPTKDYNNNLHILKYNLFQLAYITQYLNFGDYNIISINEKQKASIINSRTKKKEKPVDVALAYEKVALLNFEKEYDFLNNILNCNDDICKKKRVVVMMTLSFTMV